MGLAQKLLELRWRAAGHYTRRLPHSFLRPLEGADVLEVGGPSAVFRSDGLLPVYAVCRRIDGAQFAARTVWHQLDEEGSYVPEPGGPSGALHISEATDLGGLDAGRYDAVISSHVIEHLADPLRALREWRRVSHANGHLLLVAPHKAGTFDHRRPTTTLEHLREDFERRTTEDDLTHLEETLALHDRSRDVQLGDPGDFERLRRENSSHRLLHHHVFTTRSLLRLLDAAGLQLIAAEVRHPHDIYVIGQWAAGAPDNKAFLEPDAPHARASPFGVDRSPAGV
jgi:SAM-dependent methyltransferase